MAFVWELHMERVRCAKCALNFALPQNLNMLGSMSTIYCPGCGGDYRRGDGITEATRLRVLNNEACAEQARLGRVIAGLRGALNARKTKTRKEPRT